MWKEFFWGIMTKSVPGGLLMIVIVLFFWMFWIAAAVFVQNLSLAGLAGTGFNQIVTFMFVVFMIYFVIRTLTNHVIEIFKPEQPVSLCLNCH
jgi:hypothetical protein